MLESRNKLIIIYCMAEQKASFYVMVLTAIIDHDLHVKEAEKINEIANKYKIKFDPYEASSDIKNISFCIIKLANLAISFLDEEAPVGLL